MSKYNDQCYEVLKEADIFPIEVDLAHTTLAYGQGDVFTDEDEELDNKKGKDKEEKLIDNE